MTYYSSGDWNGICDVCGRKFKMSQLRPRWDGLMVCAGDWETRHPQEFVRGIKDVQTVPVARPESTDVFIHPILGALNLYSALPGIYYWFGTLSTIYVPTSFSSIIGSYSWSGLSCTLANEVNAITGTYSWTSTAATLTSSGASYQVIINTVTGSYSWIGAVNTNIATQINFVPGVYTWSGVTALLGVNLKATIGSYTWTGITSNIISIPTGLYTTPGIYYYTIPGGVTTLFIEGWGGGGGGGGGQLDDWNAGQGTGGTQTVIDLASTLGQLVIAGSGMGGLSSIYLQVAHGGMGGQPSFGDSQNPGNSGGDTSTPVGGIGGNSGYDVSGHYGQGGNGGNSSTHLGGGGGGGGAYVMKQYHSPAAGTVISLSVGSKGLGGYGYNNGSNGMDGAVRITWV